MLMGDIATPRGIGLLREKPIAASLQQIEESRRLIRQSRVPIDLGAKDIVRSGETIAEARRILARVRVR